MDAAPATFRWEDDQIVADLPHARAVFSTARGGVSSGPFASLNLGLLTDDAPENVAENRRRLGELVGHPWPRFCYGRQVHGTTVRRATEPPSAERPVHARRTARRRRSPTPPRSSSSPTACRSCSPPTAASPRCTAAGGRSRAGSSTRACARCARSAATGPITAALGPSARGCCYEVGEEVHAHFAAYDARRGERNLDLAAVARAQLEAHGIEVLDIGLCTICDERFFSHRRDKGVTGRQAGVICRA